MNRTRTLIASCCIAMLAGPAALACDKDKSAGCDKAQPTVLKVKSGSCGEKDARKVVEAARIAQNCTSAKGVANVVSASDCETACPKTKTVNYLMRSLKSECSDKCAKKSDVVAALKTMSTYEKGLICEDSLMKAVANVRTSGACEPSDCSKGAANVKTVGKGSCSSSKGAANVKTVGKGSCSTSKGVANVQTVGKGSCSSSKGAANVKTVGKGSCSSSKGVANVQTVGKGSCSTSKGVANVQTAGKGSCSSSKSVASVKTVGKGSCDPSDCSKGVANMKTVGKGSCDPADCSKGVANMKTVGKGACDPAACSTNAKVASAPLSDCSGKGAAKIVAAGQGSGCCASKAKGVNANVVNAGNTCSSDTKYVAYGCDKTDRVARAAAKAYLAMMAELKDLNGAEACSLDAAKQVLAKVMADMEKKTEVAAVSFGAVSEKKSCGSN